MITSVLGAPGSGKSTIAPALAGLLPGHAVVDWDAFMGVCTPDELKDWPIDTWVLLDCSEQERHRRLARHANPQRLADAIHDGREYRQLGLPVIETTGARPWRSPPSLRGSSSRFTRAEIQRTWG